MQSISDLGRAPSAPLGFRTDSHNRDWVVPAFWFVSLQYLAAVILSQKLGFAAPSPAFRYAAIGLGVSVFLGLAWVVVFSLRLAIAGVRNPIGELTATIRRNARNLIYGQIGVQLVGLQLGALTWLKAMLPVAVPFWADPMLADLDAAVFGSDPRALIHPYLEPLTAPISYGYSLWFLVMTGLLIAVLFAPAGRRKSQIMLAYFITIGVFGVIGQYAVSSAGPIFYERIGLGDRFNSPPFDPLVRTTADYLWMNYLKAGTGLGGGISAMPSVHVAMAGWIALSLTSLYRPLAVAGWGFFLFVCIASVFLGWHYVSDGLVGALAAIGGWTIARFVLDRFAASRGPTGPSTARANARNARRD